MKGVIYHISCVGLSYNLPRYGFYATSLMKKRNLFHACQKPSFLQMY